MAAILPPPTFRTKPSTLELDAQAQLVSQESYYPFGGTSWWAGRNAIEANYKTVRYSGKERDATGLYYYGLRYYAPWLQRWINPDPAGAVDGLNLYRMVKNNPKRYQDEQGTSPTDMNPEEEPEEVSPAPDPDRPPQSLMGVSGSLNTLFQSSKRGISLLFDWLARNNALQLIRHMLGYRKYITLDYPDFTIKQFELHSPSAQKDLVIHGHGRLRSPVHKIYNAPITLSFYAPQNSQLSASSSDLHRFQSRKIQVSPVELIGLGQESRDYEIAHSSTFEDKVAGFLHHSQLLNRKQAIESTSHLDRENYHDVLTVKRGKTVALSKLLTQLPAYGQVHALFCRSRGNSGPVHDPFAR